MKPAVPRLRLPFSVLRRRSPVLWLPSSILCLTAPAPALRAQTIWSGLGADNNWSTGANWAGTAPASSTSSAIQFAGTTRLTPNTDSAWILASITFNSGAGAFTLGGSALTLASGGTVTNSSANLQTIANSGVTLSGTSTWNAASGSLSVSSIVSGSGSLTKAGTGTLTLSGQNTFTGGLTVSVGTLQLGAASALASTNAVSLANTAGATLDLNSFNQSIGSLSGGGTTGGNVTLGSAILTTGGDNTSATFSGAISGTGGLVKAGTGTLTLSGASTYTGTTNVSAGILTLGANQALPSGTALTVGGTFLVNGKTQTIGSLAGTGTVNLAANGALTAGGDNSSTTYSGSLNGNNAGNAFTKTGTGTLTLSGTIDDSSLWVNVAQGTLVLAKTSDSTHHGAATVLSVSQGATLQLAGTGGDQIIDANAQRGVNNLAGTFDLNGRSETIAQFNGSSTGVVTNSAASTTSTLSVGNTNAASTDLIYSGVIQDGAGTTALTKLGNNTLSLSGLNTFTGGLTISAGTVQLGAAGALASTLPVTLANTAGVTLDLNSFNQSIGSLSGGGATGGNVTLGTATLTTGGANTSTTFSGIISGTGGLTKAGTGTLTLSSADTYTGTTSVAAGKLVVDTTNNATALSSASSLAFTGSGTFQLLSSSTTAARTTTMNGLTLSAGAGMIDVDNTGSQTLTLDLRGSGAAATITRSAGATVDFKATSGTFGTSAIVDTHQANVNGILGAWATVNGGTDWATNNGSDQIVAYTGYTTPTGAGPTIVSNTATNERITSASTGNVTLAATGTTDINTLLLNDSTNRTVDVRTGTTADILRFGATGGILTAGSGSYTIGLSGTAGKITAGGATNAAGELIVTAGAPLTINSVIANNGTGAVSLTKSGTSTLTLAGANTFTGGVVINAGTLSLSGGAALANTSGVTLANAAGATLALSTNETIGSFAGGGTLGGNVTLGATTLTTGGDNTSTMFAGVISGSGGSLVKSGSGTLTLTGANSYSGGTTVSGGAINFNSLANFGPGNITVLGTSGLQWATGTNTDVSGRLNALGAAAAATFDTNGNDVTFATPIAGASDSYIIKSGAGTLALPAGSTFGFGFIANAGTIAISADSALGAVPATVQADSLDFDGGTLRTTASLTIASNRSVGLSAGGGTFQTDAGTTLTYGGSITDGSAGTGGLTKSGAGTMILSGGNFYTGPTTISAGTLQIGAGGTIGNLGGGAITNNSALIFNRSDALSVANAISGTGSVTQAGAGTLTLSGANTFTGALTLNAGALTLNTTNNASALNASTPPALVFGGPATLQLLSSSSTARTTEAAGLALSSGASVIDVDRTGTANLTLDLSGNGTSGITRPAGAVVDFKATTGTFGTNAIVKSHQANDATGILGPWATVNNGADWAANNGSDVIVAYTGYNTPTGASPALASSTTANARISSASTGNVTLAATGTTALNTLAITDATARTLDVRTGTTADTLRFGAVGGILTSGGAHTIGVSGAAGTITAGGAANTAGELIVNDGSALTINSLIADNGTGVVSLTKAGPGLLTLAGANTFSGGLTIDAGSVILANSLALQNITLTSLSGSLSFGTLTSATFGSLAGTNDMALPSGVTLNVGNNNASTAYSGALSGGGSLTKIGTGTLTFAGASTYTGAITVAAGTLALGASDRLSDAGAVNVSGGTLALGAFSDTVGTVTISSGSITGTGALTGSAFAATGGTISASLAGTGALAMSGPGTLTLTGTNTYSGGTTVTAAANDVLGGGGRINFNSLANFGSGNITLNGYGTLQWATGTTTDISSRLVLSPSGGLDTNGNNVTFASPISGSVFKFGAGTLTLAAGNNLSTVEIYGGALSTDNFSSAKFAGGTLNYTGSSASATIFAGGALGGELDVTQAGQTLTLTPTLHAPLGDLGAMTFGGAGNVVLGVDVSTMTSLTKNGPGTLTLTNGTTNSGIAGLGSATVNEGTLSVSAVTQGSDPRGVGYSQSQLGAFGATFVTLGDATHQGTLSYTGNTSGFGYGLVLGAGGGRLDVTTAGQALTFASTATITGPAGSGNLTIGGAGDTIIPSNISVFGLIKTGSGTLTLSGTNSIIGTQVSGTEVDGGVLVANSSAGVTGAGAPLLSLNGGALKFSSAIDFAANRVILGANGGTIDTNGYDGSYLTLDGSGAFTKTGAGTLTLITSTFTGPTTLAGGTLALGSSAALGSSSNLTFTGGTLQFSGSNTTDYSNRFSTAANQAYNIDTNHQAVTFATALTSVGGTLTKIGYGILTLSATNTFTGGVLVGGGTLRLDTTAQAAVLNAITPPSLTFLGASTLQLLSSSTTAARTTITNGLTLSAGGGTIDVNRSGTQNVTLDLRGATGTAGITRALGGGTVDFLASAGTLGTNAIVDIHQANVNGILGAWATVNSGSDWATNNGSDQIIAYTGYTTPTGAGPTIASSAATNERITSGSTGNVTLAATGTTDLNTLLLNDSTNRTIDVRTGTTADTLRFGAIGGILATGSGSHTIGVSGSAGTITAGGAANTAGELIVNNGLLLTINSVIANNGTGVVSLTKAGTGPGPLTLTGTNTYTGPTSIEGTLQIGNGGTSGTLGTGAVMDNGTLAFNRSDAITVSNAISGNGTLAQSGTGTLTLNGSTASTFTGGTTVYAGTLTLDFSNLATPTNLLSSSSPLALDGSTLNVTGKSGAFTTSQTFAGTTINSGASAITRTPNGGTATNLSLGAITRNMGGTVDFTAPGTGNISTTSLADSTGLLGGWATVGGTDWATVSGGNIAAATYTNDTWTAGTNTNVTAAGTISFGSTTNSLRFATAGTQTLTLSGTNTIASGGILVTSAVGNNATTITGGTLLGASGQDLVVIENNPSASLTIASAIADNGSATGLTKSGAGTLILSGANTFTGPTMINAGALQIGNGGTTGTLGAGAVTDNGTLVFNRSNAVTVNNAIAGAGSLVKSGTGTTTLGGNNTYSGTTTLGGGTLALGSSGALGGGNLTFTGGALQFSASNTSDVSSRIVSSTSPIAIDTNGQNVAFSASIGASNSGGLTKLGAGTLTLSGANSYTGGTTLGGGTLALGAPGALASVGTILFSGGTLQFGAGNTSDYSARFSTAASQAYSIDTNGQSVAFGTALTSSGGSLTKLDTGTLTLSATNTYSGGTTISGGTLQVGAGGTTGSLVGNVVDNAALAFNRSTALTYSGAISGTGALTQAGTGTLTLNGSTANTFAGSTTVNAGTLTLNFTNLATPTNLLSSSSSLVLGGGTLNITGKSGAVTTSQTFGGATINPGFSSIVRTPNGGTATNLTLGAITRNAGGTVDFAAPGTGNISTTSGTTNGILGGWATVGGSDWATVSGGNIAAATYTNDTWAAGTNTNVTTNATIASGSTTNSLRFATAGIQTLTLSGTTTLTSGGILVTPAVGVNTIITGGFLRSASGTDLIVHENGPSSTLIVASTIIDNNGAPTALTKSGAGTLVLSAANTFSGPTYLNAGGLQLLNQSSLQNSTLTFNGGGLDELPLNLSPADYYFGGLAGSGNLALGVPVFVGANNASTTYSGTLALPNLIKTGTGTLTLNGSVPIGSALARTTVDGGTLNLDFANFGSANLLGSAVALEVDGGAFNVTGKSGNSTSQSFTSTTIASGASAITRATNGITNTDLSLGAITRNVGGTVDFSAPGNGNITTSSTATNGLLGGWATVGGTDWATVSGNNIVAATYTNDTWAAANNTNVTATGTITSGSTTNSLRFATTGNQTLTLAGTNTLTSGGILVTSAVGANTTTITGGTLRGASGADLVVIEDNPSGGLTIASVIADNGSATGLTKSGTGTLTLSAANTFTGATFANAGALALTNALALQNSTLTITSAGTVSLPAATAVTLGGLAGAGNLAFGGGTLTVGGNNLDGAYSGVLSSQSPNQSGTFVKNGTGTLTFSGSMAFGGALGGALTINAGTLRSGADDVFGTFPAATNGLFDSGKYVTVASGATLDLNGHAQTIYQLSGSGTVALGTLGAGTLTIGGTVGGPTTSTFAGTISGNGGLTTSNASVTLSGANTYNGPTTVLSPFGFSNIVQFAKETSLSSHTTLTVGPSATAAFNVGGTGEFTAADIDTLKSLGDASTGFTSGASLGLDTTNAPGGVFTYGSAIANPNGGANSLGLGKLGSGTLVLTGANTYTGTTAIYAGTLQIGNGGTSGTIGGPVRNAGALVFNRSDAFVLANPISGSGSLTQAGPGVLLLSGSNNYSGTTTVAAGMLQFANQGAFYNNTPSSWTATNLVVNSGATAAFNVGGSGEFTPTNLTTLFGLGTGTGGFKSGSFIGLDTTNAAGGFTYPGTIANPNSGTNILGLVKLGANTLTLSGTNSYSGGTTISGGALAVSADANLGAAAGAVTFDGGALQTTASFTSTRATTLLAGGGTFDVAGSGTTLTWNGNISGPPGNPLTKIGAGTLLLGGTNTYAGTTFINVGTLRLANSNAFSPATTIEVASGATFDANGFTQTFSGLTGSGNVDLGTQGITVAPSGTSNYTGQLSGTGGLALNGPGTLVLGAANNFSGPVTLTQGTLQLGAAGALPSGAPINLGSGATLDLNGHGATLGSLAGAGGIVALNGGANLAVAQATNTAFGGVISGNGGLTKSGGGVLTLTGTNTFSGATAINGGEIKLNGSAASSAFTLTGGTLSGNATIGALTIGSGGTLSPGNSPGTTNAGATTFGSGGAYQWQTNNATAAAGTNQDFLNITGTLNLTATSANPFTVSIFSLTGSNTAGPVINFNSATNYSYAIATASGGITGYNPADFTLNTAGFTNALNGGNWSLGVVGNSLDLNFTASAIPEPSTYAALLGVVTLGFALRRRRRAHPSPDAAATNSHR